MTKPTTLLLPLCFFLGFSSCLVMPASTLSASSTSNWEASTNETSTDLSSLSPDQKVATNSGATASTSLDLFAIASGVFVGVIGFGLLIHSNRQHRR